MWILAFLTGYAVIFGINIPKVLFNNAPLTLTGSAIYGGLHRFAWAIAVGWVIFASCKGYGGNYIFKNFSFNEP